MKIILMLLCVLTAFCGFAEEYPLYPGLNTYRMQTTLKTEQARKYFDQGLLLYYGYNYPEAARSFEAAAKLEPDSGIAYWGISLAYCDCIEAPDDQWHRKAFDAYKKALGAKASAAPKEKDLIDALEVRFHQDHGKSPGEAFAETMQTLQQKYPQDPDITAIYSNVAMRNIDLFHGIRDQNLRGPAEKMIGILEGSMKSNPNHPGLNHFYIHAMEAAGTAGKALGAAERLDGAVPGSGHLEHMPAHIYFFYGKYREATEANQKGIEADDRMFAMGGIKNPEFAGFYLHNYYYLFQSLLMEGRLNEAVEASQQIAGRLRNGDLPSNAYLEDAFFAVPYFLMARAGKWDQISKEPLPPKDLIFANAARDYALGLAALRKGDVAGTRAALAQLKKSATEYEKGKGTGRPYNPSLTKILQITALDLASEIDAKAGNHDLQIQTLKNAVAIEDTLDFHMLPWYPSRRHPLGAALFKSGNFEEAEKIYREDLVLFPHNPWGLSGLVLSLEAQKKETAEFKEQLGVAMRHADPSFPTLSR